MPDVFSPEDARKIFIVSVRGIIAANSQDNVYVPQRLQPCRVLLILDEVAGIIEIDIVW